MQHNRAGRKLGRTSAHRRSLFRNQLASLFEHERITTTLHKAKELRPLAEKMVTLGKRGGLHARRLALRTVPDNLIVGRLFGEIAPRFSGRAGGYTRILKLGRRPGDGAEMAILEFIDYDWAQRRAEKQVAATQDQPKKESLLDKARRLVTGRSASDKPAEGAAAAEGEAKGEKAAPAEKAGKAEKAEKAPKAAKPKRAGGTKMDGGDGKTKVSKTRVSPAGKKGPSKGGTPRKVGS